MKVFPALCKRAKLAGAQTLTFTADLELTGGDDGVGTDEAWTCTSLVGDTLFTVGGRTGEEALRGLVAVLEAR